MSSDESTSTISTISNLTESKQSNVPKPGKWEINIIGNFLLNLYHRSIITLKDGWCLKKSELRREYLQFVTAEQREQLKELHGTDDIGTLLSRCKFLLNTPRGSPLYKIKSKSLFDFRNNKLTELDNMKIDSDCITQKMMINGKESDDSTLMNLLQNKSIQFEEDNSEIDMSMPKILLEYQGTIIRKRVSNFCSTNMSCNICQEDYATMESFEEHIQMHGEDSDFEFLKEMDKFSQPIFVMSYRLCKNSHNFCFEFETNLEDIIIEKIIIVQSRSFFYVHNTLVPYEMPENGVNRFFVDSHLFTRHVEQPIVLICNFKDSKDSRVIEQHHFMRSEEFPKVNFSINPYRLPNKKLFKAKFELPDYFPPREIQDALKDDFYYEKLMKTSNEFRDYVRNGKNLQPQTIGASLNILLQIEDMDTIRQYLRLKQKNIKIRSYGDEYSFQLKPQQRIFVENILSAYDEVVLTTRSDIFENNNEIFQLLMQNKSDIKRMKNTFVGLVEAVNTGRISFKCDQKIDIHGLYTVICRPSRLNFRYQYRSLELLPTNMDFLKKFLFPAKVIPMPLSTITLDLYNKNLNAEQLQAVRNIAEGPRNDATYIIFGPPGTGKTTTLVEGILQILKKPNTKILVSASSNSACDEVALRLCKYLNPLNITRAMVRIYSRSSEVRTDTIDDELLENSNMYNGQFYPDIEILHEYRVVICTLSIVAKLATGKFGRKDNGATLYTHLFIDEVAASMEAEALMAITTALTSKSCLIISGDNKQLGPILQSKRAKELGLDASLMDRLLARDCYRVDIDTGDYERSIQTRLVRNHRSHPAIVNLYSGLYYNHSLEAVAKPEDVSLCEIWHKARNKQYPIIFHAIYEHSYSDKRSHSLYNLKELEVVMDYVKDFMYFGINGEPVNESDIGIISPYKNQYKRIEEELKLRKWFNIETGSVEIFQGKEKNIIIVSFTRSGTDNLGFLDCPRRLNVTLSRAKSILILIGNPKTLSLNTEFEYIIKECQRNNTFVGSNGPTKRDPNQLNKKMQGLGIESFNQEKSQKNREGGHGISFKNDENENENGEESDESNGNEKSAMATKTLMPDKSFDKDVHHEKKNRRRNRQPNRRERKNLKLNVNKDDNDQNEEENNDDENQDNGDDKPINSAVTQKNTNSKQNSRKGNDMKKSRNQHHVAANDGKISKQHGKGGYKKSMERNKNSSINKIDYLLKELPEVPKTVQQGNEIYLKAQLQQLQQQQQIYLNLLQHNNNHNNNNINPLFNLPTTSANRQADRMFNVNKNLQQQPNFNTSYPAMHYNTHSNTPNYFNNQQQPLNYSNPIMNYNSNALYFSNVQSTVPNKQSNYATTGSTAAVGALNVSSAKENNYRKNNSKIESKAFNSTGPVRKPPRFAVNAKKEGINLNASNNSSSPSLNISSTKEDNKSLKNKPMAESNAVNATGAVKKSAAVTDKQEGINLNASNSSSHNDTKMSSSVKSENTLNKTFTANAVGVGEEANKIAERKLESPETRSMKNVNNKPLYTNTTINQISNASGINRTNTTTIASTNPNTLASTASVSPLISAKLNSSSNLTNNLNASPSSTITSPTNPNPLASAASVSSVSNITNNSSYNSTNKLNASTASTIRSPNVPATYYNNRRFNGNSASANNFGNVRTNASQTRRKDDKSSCVIS